MEMAGESSMNGRLGVWGEYTRNGHGGRSGGHGAGAEQKVYNAMRRKEAMREGGDGKQGVL